jgi:PilZ domain
MEHRWGHRREISRAVRIGTRNGLAAKGRICNVSISGAFVASPIPISLYSHVELRFAALIDGKRTAIALEGQVVRREAAGFGVEWSVFAAEAVRALIAVPPFRLAETPPHTRAEREPTRQPPARFHN